MAGAPAAEALVAEAPVEAPAEAPVEAPAEAPAEAAEAAEAPLPWCTVLDHGAGLREVTIIKAIEEYLAYHRLQEPLAAFQREIERVGLLRSPNIALNAVREVEDVLCSLDAGDQAAFSSAWSRVMPDHEATSKVGALQLRLQANFAIHRARLALQNGKEPDVSEMQEDLKPFLTFLNERGLDEMSGDEALMPLFALPFVQRPHAHPDVREVFSLQWFQDLRRDVEAALRSQRPIPRIYDILDRSPTEQGKRSWQSVWAELLRLADASLDSMMLLAQGSPAPPVLSSARQQLELLREHIPRGLELQLKSHLDRGACPMSPARSVRSRAATSRPQLAHQLDFGALKTFLCATPQQRREAFGEVAATLPQVLRAVLQRLASAESPLPQRRGFLVAITCFDVLGVRDQPNALPALLKDEYSHYSQVDSELTQLLTLGILAVLACEAVGRSYVVSSSSCVKRMVELLKSKPLDSSIHIQALAAMQRLSLRRSAQDCMIEMGMVEWAVCVLSSQEEGASRAPSEFSLEFGSAMLMNLALRSTGKRKCLEQDVLPMAMKLMEHWNPQIRTHINGTLYSLLSLSGFRQSARNAGLEMALRSIHRQASSLGDEVAVRQLEYLLEQLNLVEEEPSHVPAVASLVFDEALEIESTESGEDDEEDDENFLEEEELAGLLLGDRCGQSADEALRPFAAKPAVLEVQQREFESCVGRNYMQSL